jgi:hypothetical protein
MESETSPRPPRAALSFQNQTHTRPAAQTGSTSNQLTPNAPYKPAPAKAGWSAFRWSARRSRASGTADYQAWVEALARNHRLPIEGAEKGVRKEDHVVPWQRRMAQKRADGVYYIFKSMEQGPTFRVSVPKYPTQGPHHRILAPSAAASHTTISIFATKPWARW